MNLFRILIIDDDLLQRKIIEQILKSIDKKIKIYCANNGQEALKIIKTDLPNLIITDWDMPQMNGIDFCKTIQRNKKLKHVPVIMCTGIKTSSENLQTAFESGVADFIRKPIDKMELLSRANSMIKLSESYQTIKLQKEELQKEIEKSDKLLLNVLPEKVATELKNKGKTEPELFDNVTVLYSDIVGFTELTTKIDPKDLIRELNDIISEFDEIMERNQCERIKTVGDAYIAVCGMPIPNTNHVKNIVRAAIEIINYLENRNKTNNHEWKIRVGIDTGKVVGGIIGTKKYIYDIFGDPINTASRLESNSETMRINLSETTYKLVEKEFNFEEQAPIEVKGKGKMKMYFVKTP
jgi:class 3 adenylate cyclase/AmiR/NasT family two-component response regulator